MGRQIAVLMSAINVGNQRKMLEGMIDAARETDSNLFVFTCHLRYDEKEENQQGAYRIMKLPDFRCFDGVIIARNTIQHKKTAEEVVAAVLESGIPAVSIDAEISGIDYIGITDYDAQYQMIEHLITQHDCRDICYVSGPVGNVAAEARLRAYVDALKKHGIAWREENLYRGHWDALSGGDAVRQFIEQRGCPEAVVCGNDQMASGALEAIKELGYRVPENVRVAGFDDEELSTYLDPPLASVDKNQFGEGREAVLSLVNSERGREPRRTILPSYPVFRESCGCRECDTADIKKLKAKYVRNRQRTHMVADDIKNMISDFGGMEQPEELIEPLKKYLLKTDMDIFYLCLCERDKIFGVSQADEAGEVNLQEMDVNYTEEITIPLAYENGEFRSYESFPKGMVLPEECRNRQGGNFFVVVPIYYQKCCFGYCISGNSLYPIEDGLYYSWLMNIGIGLENIRKWMLLKTTVARLNRMWIYDMLTHLYNRAGFFHLAEPMMQELYSRGADAFLIFMDIDGLKTLNDTRGHEMGDALIGAVAKIVRESVREGELAMRYGGDEFVVFGEQQGARMEELIGQIHAGMDAWNREGHEFQVSASTGGISFAVMDMDNLEVRIEQADKQMYQEKKEKKRRQCQE